MSNRDREEERNGRSRPKRISPLADPTVVIDYKNPALLKYFVSDRGKIVPSRVSNVNSRQQRQLTRAIRRARILAVLAYSAE